MFTEEIRPELYDAMAMHRNTGNRAHALDWIAQGHTPNASEWNGLGYFIVELAPAQSTEQFKAAMLMADFAHGQHRQQKHLETHAALVSWLDDLCTVLDSRSKLLREPLHLFIIDNMPLFCPSYTLRKPWWPSQNMTKRANVGWIVRWSS